VDKRVYYDEGIFVGYRWFDENEIEPLFPFGFGLSYTEFEHRNLRLDKQRVTDSNDFVVASIDIENTGNREGSEVVQMYLKDIECSVPRPPKELVGFEKIIVGPGEIKTVDVKIKAQDFAFYDEEEHAWKIEGGEFRILSGRSSHDIHHEVELQFARSG
jgi:beta-glucosidase